MEPADAQSHYNEKLLLLPGIGTRYRMPEIPAESKHKTRADFQLPEGKVLYLFPQSLFKVHPDTDRLLVDVLAQNIDATLVMFASHSPGVTQRFVARMHRAFEAAHLPSAGRVKILPGLGHGDYKRVNQLCDVMLDSLHWSGGNTSLDALAAGIPIITLPGTMMRGRQSGAMLKMIGLDELVVADVNDYVSLAVALGRDSARRHQLSEKICANRHGLFDDPRPAGQLNALFSMMAAGVRPAADGKG
jgi:CRISPR-associated protein Csy1